MTDHPELSQLLGGMPANATAAMHKGSCVQTSIEVSQYGHASNTATRLYANQS